MCGEREVRRLLDLTEGLAENCALAGCRKLLFPSVSRDSYVQSFTTYSGSFDAWSQYPASRGIQLSLAGGMGLDDPSATAHQAIRRQNLVCGARGLS